MRDNLWGFAVFLLAVVGLSVWIGFEKGMTAERARAGVVCE